MRRSSRVNRGAETEPLNQSGDRYHLSEWREALDSRLRTLKDLLDDYVIVHPYIPTFPRSLPSFFLIFVVPVSAHPAMPALGLAGPNTYQRAYSLPSAVLLVSCENLLSRVAMFSGSGWRLHS